MKEIKLNDDLIKFPVLLDGIHCVIRNTDSVNEHTKTETSRRFILDDFNSVDFHSLKTT